MQLFLLMALFGLYALATGGDATKPEDQSYLPRYTLLAESKKKDQYVDSNNNNVVAAEQQPWRRFVHAAGYGSTQSSWPAGSAPVASLAALLGPGLLLLGVNLGALLYMLLGVLGLAPPQRLGTWQSQEIYRNDRQQDLGGGKELDMYL